MKSSRHAEPRRTHRLTRLGFHFLFVGAFAMLGGALRGFNLLLVLAGLLVGALIVQWRWSKRSVESVSVNRRLPPEAFAGKSFRVRFRLHNRSRFMPAWMMRVEDTIQLLSSSGKESTVAVCGVGVITPSQTVVPYFDCLVTRRGVYRFGPATISTTFPFSLIVSRQTADAEVELSVYPKLLHLRARWQRNLLSRTGGVTVTARRSGPTEGDFFGLREWQTGDSPKWIHWRTTARLGEPAVRQFEQQRRFDTCVLVDGFVPDTTSGETEAETAISLAATFLVHLVGSPSNRLVLAIGAETSEAVVGGGSREGKRRMLSMLAEMKPCREPQLGEAALKALHIVGQTQDLIVVSTRDLPDALRDDDSLSNVLQPWVRRGSIRWINVGRELDHWVMREATTGEPGATPASLPEQGQPAETLRTEGPGSE